MNFLRSFLAALLALVVFSILSIFLLMGFIAAITAEEQVVVNDKSVLQLNLDAQITEQEIEDPFEGLPIPGSRIPTIGLLQLKSVLRHASEDPKIEGILLNVNYPMAGFAKVAEVRESIIKFRESGKWVIAYAEAMSEQAYYLASAADRVFLNREGEVEFNGLVVEVTFFKRLFDKLEIKPEVFRVGEFKSAVEPFTNEKMSDQNRLQLNELITSIYDNVLDQIAESRNISKARLEEISDKMLARNGELAVELGLIDSLVYYDQVLDELRERLSVEEGKKVNFIKYNRYKKVVSNYKSSKNEIALIVADGTIMPGGADQGVIGSKTFTEEIRKARENDNVKAIVLRVNSPGGSFQASDEIWREVTLASKAKPIIASMSDYAASGGYYISMGCDTIVAQPHTITGSIGIFSVLFDASGLLNNKIGITSDEVRTGELGDLVTISRPLSDAEKNVWQTRTNEIYETFTGKAADGRGMDIEEIKQIAQGRVWTGDQAIENGLVDILGGIDDAIDIAAKAAGVEDDYKVKIYPKQQPFFEKLLNTLEENSRTNSIKAELGDYYPFYLQWQHLKTIHGVQARMPYEITIH